MTFEPYVPEPQPDIPGYDPSLPNGPGPAAENGTFEDEVLPVSPEEADLNTVDESLGVDEDAEEIEDWEDEEDEEGWDVDDEEFEDDDFDDEE